MTVVQSSYERKENELYETEAWVTRALLRHVDIAGMSVWEPAAGNHAMADVILSDGGCRDVWTSDIATYDRQHSRVLDFFADNAGPPGLDAIITNPPYGKQNRDAVRFARLSLQRCPGLVALLLTAKFDSGNTRSDLFRDNSRYAGKIVLTDRIQWFAGKSTGTEDHAWYVWGPSQPFPQMPVIRYAGRSS